MLLQAGFLQLRRAGAPLQLRRAGAPLQLRRAGAPLQLRRAGEIVVLKLNIQKTEIMASGPITSWQIDGETVETVETLADFIFFGCKITADGEIGRAHV